MDFRQVEIWYRCGLQTVGMTGCMDAEPVSSECVDRRGEAGRQAGIRGPVGSREHIRCVPACGFLLFLEHTTHFPLSGPLHLVLALLGLFLPHICHNLPSFLSKLSFVGTSSGRLPRSHLLPELLPLSYGPHASLPCLTLLWFNSYSTSTTRWSIY